MKFFVQSAVASFIPSYMAPLLTTSALRAQCIDRSADYAYSLGELRGRQRPGTFLAVLGDPIAHSLSPRMHKAALEELAAVDNQFFAWRYIKVRILPEELPFALPLLHGRNFVGLNITLPHKVSIIPLLTGITPRAQAIGAVNMLVRTPMGYEGDNKDAAAFLFAAEHLLSASPTPSLAIEPLRVPAPVDWAGIPVVVWGAGGGARAAIYQLLQSGVRKLYVGNRSPQRLEALEKAMRPLFPADVQWQTFLFDAIPGDLPQDALFIQATPQGLSPTDPLPIPLHLMGPSASLYDMVYSQNETPMVHAAREKGLRAADGCLMLARQGALALEAWTGRPVSTAAMVKALVNQSIP